MIGWGWLRSSTRRSRDTVSPGPSTSLEDQSSPLLIDGRSQRNSCSRDIENKGEADIFLAKDKTM